MKISRLIYWIKNGNKFNHHKSYKKIKRPVLFEIFNTLEKAKFLCLKIKKIIPKNVIERIKKLNKVSLYILFTNKSFK